MLFVVLLLVAAAAGVLAGAVATGHPQWAWISVVLSALAAALLIVASARRRRRSRAASAGAGADSEQLSEEPESPDPETGEQSANSDPAEHVATHGAVEAAVAADDEPAEEDTDAADALVVSELETTVAVVDERPRYHLEDCDWASRHATIAVPVWEARDLGFTPCALCEPDATLAARQRATH